MLDSGVLSPGQIPFPLLPEIELSAHARILLPNEANSIFAWGFGTSLFAAVWGTSHRCACLQAGPLLQPPHPALDQLLQMAGCPALSVLLTSLTLFFCRSRRSKPPQATK